jgi:hypothetical protein
LLAGSLDVIFDIAVGQWQLYLAKLLCNSLLACCCTGHADADAAVHATAFHMLLVKHETHFIACQQLLSRTGWLYYPAVVR